VAPDPGGSQTSSKMEEIKKLNGLKSLWTLLLKIGRPVKKFRKRYTAFFIKIFFLHCNFFQIFVTKNQNQIPMEQNASRSGSALIQSGSETELKNPRIHPTLNI
jgi:hypothetical protein